MDQSRFFDVLTLFIRGKNVGRKGAVLIAVTALGICMLMQLQATQNTQTSMIRVGSEGAESHLDSSWTRSQKLDGELRQNPKLYKLLRSIMKVFRAKLDTDFRSFSEQLGSNMKSVMKSVATSQRKSTSTKQSTKMSRIIPLAKSSIQTAPPAKSKPAPAQRADLRVETYTALDVALQRQLLHSCIAKHRPAAALSRRALKDVKDSCLARIAHRIIHDLESPRAAPRTILARKRLPWAPHHFHTIGYEPPRHNYTHFVHANIARHSAPVRANPYDDPAPTDDSAAALERAGVLVEPLLPEHHRWGPDGRDHYNATAAPPYRYAGAKQPYWAFNNHALKSQASAPLPSSIHTARRWIFAAQHLSEERQGTDT
jgi:hypothetical protein